MKNQTKDKAILLGKFVRMLWQKYDIFLNPAGGTAGKETLRELFVYGRQKGWLEETDVIRRREPVVRKDAARILHEFLKKELKEADERDWKEAKRLKDLYDCHRCVGHVAQIFVKGIIACDTVFGMEETISLSEAEAITDRLFDTGKRLQVREKKSPVRETAAGEMTGRAFKAGQLPDF